MFFLVTMLKLMLHHTVLWSVSPQTGLHPILVLAYMTLLPYIFFLGILPARSVHF